MTTYHKKMKVQPMSVMAFISTEKNYQESTRTEKEDKIVNELKSS